MGHRALQDHVGVDAHQGALVVGVAIAGSGLTGADDAQDRAGVAAHLAVCRVAHEGGPCAMRDWQRCTVVAAVVKLGLGVG